MQLIPDDPIVQSIERTGYPPWMQGHYFPGCDAYYPDEEEYDEYEEEDTEDGESDY